jgi:hypothetical protein
MKQFEIFLKDLTPDAQKRFREVFGSNAQNEDDGNWDVTPISIIELDPLPEPKIQQNIHVSVRVNEWREFSNHMEKYIEKNTLDKYGMVDYGDFMSLSKSVPMICIWNVMKYSIRIWNRQGKEHDVEKMAHYAQRFWLLTRPINSIATPSM